MQSNRYTAAMLAELVRVHVARVRYWQKQGWIVPVEQTHRLAYFDFNELNVARTLAELVRSGASSRLLRRELAEIQRRFPDVTRPLAELTLEVDGRTLLVRRSDGLIDAAGQLRLDFDGGQRDDDLEAPATIVSPAFLLAHKASNLPAEAAPARLAALAADFEEAGDLQAAAESYRAALAAGGPQPELCFQLADVLYRSGDLAGSRERYFMALELDEEYIEARVNLGCVLLELGDAELATSAFEGALHSHEEYIDAHFHLARTLDRLGRTDEALHHWHRFLELAPESPWAAEAQLRLNQNAAHGAP